MGHQLKNFEFDSNSLLFLDAFHPPFPPKIMSFVTNHSSGVIDVITFPVIDKVIHVYIERK